MNKKAQTFMIGLMLGVMGFIFALAMTAPLKESIGLARTDMTCTLTTLSAGEVAACIIIDWSFPIFVGVVLAVSYSWLSGKNKLGQLPNMGN